MSDNSQLLACVLIPVDDRQLLLPNVSIAEVVDFSQTTTDSDGPDWLLGFIPWRGQHLPVISYDAANGQTPAREPASRGRIAVLNSIGEHHRKLPFIALATRGIPSQTRIDPSQLHTVDEEGGPADLMQVEVDGERACIPSLEYLESLAATTLNG